MEKENKKPGINLNQNLVTFIIGLIAVGSFLTGLVKSFSQIGSNAEDIAAIVVSIEQNEKDQKQRLKDLENKAMLIIQNLNQDQEKDLKIVDDRLSKKIKIQNELMELLTLVRIEQAKQQKDIYYLKK